MVKEKTPFAPGLTPLLTWWIQTARQNALPSELRPYSMYGERFGYYGTAVLSAIAKFDLKQDCLLSSNATCGMAVL